MMKSLVLTLLLTLSPMVWSGGISDRDFSSVAEEARFKELIAELRCLVCQNQNLADSDAELARDLREEVHRMLREGKSDREVLDFMVTRYGDFVLYRPPVQSNTVLLWVGPFVILAIGILTAIVFVRRHRLNAGEADDGDDPNQNLKDQA
ncbi:MAG: cytochrome c-type biogenesis protein [Thiotrichales bacterium]